MSDDDPDPLRPWPQMATAGALEPWSYKVVPASAENFEGVAMLHQNHHIGIR